MINQTERVLRGCENSSFFYALKSINLARAFSPFLFLGVFLFLPVNAYSSVIDLSIISYIESHNNPLAYNRISQATGLFQIVPVCLADYNQFHKIKYTQKDLFNPAVNKRVASWYLNRRIPQLVKAKGRKTTKRNVLISYNAGHCYITKKHIPKETRDYIVKYKKLEKK